MSEVFTNKGAKVFVYLTLAGYEIVVMSRNNVRFNILLSGDIIKSYKYSTESKKQGPIVVTKKELDETIKLIEYSLTQPQKGLYCKGIQIGIYSEYISLNHKYTGFDLNISNGGIHDFLFGLKVLRSKILGEKLLDNYL